jgi:RimJ/RimL family protein N-acetyltransferase
MTRLIEARDGDFLWILGRGAPVTPGLTLPPGGVDAPEIIEIVRDMARKVRAGHDRGAWMMVEAGEVVGLCSYKAPPDPAGAVEIGYGVAPARRRQGHARRAVAAMIAIARDDPAVNVLLAVTSVVNAASQRCLIANGFVECDRADDPEDGPVILWTLELG